MTEPGVNIPLSMHEYELEGLSFKLVNCNELSNIALKKFNYRQGKIITTCPGEVCHPSRRTPDPLVLPASFVPSENLLPCNFHNNSPKFTVFSN